MKSTPVRARDVYTWGRRIALALALGVASGALATTPGGAFLARLGIDFLLPARDWFSGPLFPPSESDVVVVAIDEETYRTAPFAETPRVAWTPMVQGGAVHAGYLSIFNILPYRSGQPSGALL